MDLLEQTGEKFNLDIYLRARILCQNIVLKIASKVSEGMTEIDGQHLINEEFHKAGINKFWHPSKFRIGLDTNKSFRALPDASISLSAGEIFFIDVGPIIEDHEADYGETFIFGQNAMLATLANASKEVWLQTAKAWKEKRITGLELLEVARNFSSSRRLKLNTEMAGHRLGDFPHALFSKEKLFNLDIAPSKNLWVLEIHVLNEELKRGAFFEDILMD